MPPRDPRTDPHSGDVISTDTGVRLEVLERTRDIADLGAAPFGKDG
jgi:hypothetical protein